MSRLIGEVLWFNQAKGIGEIVSADGRRILAHYEQIVSPDEIKHLKPGQAVSFDLVKKKPYRHLDHLEGATKIKSI